MEQITLILDNIRSSHNVGAILRSAAAFGVRQMVMLGITPYPLQTHDERLPHVARKAHRDIAKTALGAEELVECRHYQDSNDFLSEFTQDLYALEQTPQALPLHTFVPNPPFGLIVGSETEGVSQLLLQRSSHLVIPHSTRKESLNVASACAVALYSCSVSLEN